MTESASQLIVQVRQQGLQPNGHLRRLFSASREVFRAQRAVQLFRVGQQALWPDVVTMALVCAQDVRCAHLLHLSSACGQVVRV